MRIQTLDELREEAQISQRLWVKVLGMLQQNWCVIEDGTGDAVELVSLFGIKEPAVFGI